MEVLEIAEGLWQWTVDHPDWRSDQGREDTWDAAVNCTYYEPPGREVIVLIDPLAPPAGSADATRFWNALDGDVARLAVPVAVLLTTHFHQRSAAEIHARYRGGPGAAVWSHADAVDRVRGEVTDPFRPGDALPGDVTAHAILGLEEPEVAFHLPSRRALVVGDALLGAGLAGVRVPSEGWANPTPEGLARYRERFRPSLRRLQDLAADVILVSHGESVTAGGGDALAVALAS